MKGISFFLAVATLSPCLILSSCAEETQMIETNEIQTATIQSLNQEIKRLNLELDSLVSTDADLARAKSDFERWAANGTGNDAVKISSVASALSLKILQRNLFIPGSSYFKRSSMRFLERFSKQLRPYVEPKIIFIRISPDEKPLFSARLKSAEDLAYARSMELTNFLVEQMNFPADHVATVMTKAKKNLPEEDSHEDAWVEILLTMHRLPSYV